MKYLYKAYYLDRSYILAYTLNSIANGYVFSGFDRQARQYFEELFKLNNNAIAYYSYLGFVEFSMGNIGKAIEWAEKAWETDSSSETGIKYPVLPKFLMIRYTYVGNNKEAFRYLKLYFRLMHYESFALTREVINSNMNDLHRLGYVLYKQGYKEIAREYFNKQIDIYMESVKRNDEGVTRGTTYYDLFAIYSFLGDREKAFHYLGLLKEKNYFPSWMISYFRVDPLIDSNRNDPRFLDFMQQAEEKNRAEHERVKLWMKEEGMI